MSFFESGSIDEIPIYFSGIGGGGGGVLRTFVGAGGGVALAADPVAEPAGFRELPGVTGGAGGAGGGPY